MFKYDKKLQYPVNIKHKDLKIAKNLLSQFGGPQSELAAAMRYFSQKFSMPDEKGRAILSDIAVEELGHLEIIAAMVYQLTKGATPEEMENAGMGSTFTEHGKGIFPSNADGVPFTAAYFAVTGDPIADVMEDMAAEQKARAIYENLIDLTNDEDVIGPLLFLRQREIIHFNRFQELYEHYKKQGY